MLKFEPIYANREASACGKQRHAGNSGMRETAACGKQRHAGNSGMWETAACGKQRHVGNSGMRETAACGKQRHAGNSGMGPPSLRRFFFWDARSQKKKVSGRPMPIYTDWRTLSSTLPAPWFSKKRIGGRPAVLKDGYSQRRCDYFGICCKILMRRYLFHRGGHRTRRLS